MNELNTIINQDCLVGLRNLPDNSIDCCVTSPPYFGLRDYGTTAQIGLEETPDAFVAKLQAVFTEVRRVLKPEGTLWLNLGDSYATNSGSYKSSAATGKAAYISADTEKQIIKRSKIHPGLKSKDLIGIPWMVAFALRSSGWYLRQDIIWSKPNPMPESVTDRCTKSHEYIFMLSKSSKYYYDHEAIKTVAKNPADDIRRMEQQDSNNKSNPTSLNNGLRTRGDKQRGHGRRHEGFNERWDNMSKSEQSNNGANKRSVWTVATRPFSDAHFATFPENLIIDCIKAGCPENGIVLDPFMGAGTTALVSSKLGRNYIGFELNPSYIGIAAKRLQDQLGFFYKGA